MSENQGFTLQDVTIFPQDIQTLNNGCCINDGIIHFYLRLIQNNFKGSSNSFYFFMPCSVQLIQAFEVQNIKEIFRGLNLFNYQYVFFILSDFNLSTLSSNHWSLVILHNNDGQQIFYHFDSLNQSNEKQAKLFINKICKIFDIQNESCVPISSIRQVNCYDCGVYVIAFIENFLSNGYNFNAAADLLTPQYITDFRHMMKKRITEFITNSK